MITTAMHALALRPRSVAIALACLLAAPLAAQDLRSEFAWQWPIEAPGDAGLLTLTLDEAVYARVHDQDLADLVVLDASGAPVPFGPAVGPLQRAAMLQPAPVPVPMFVVPRSTGRGGDGIALQLARGSDGSLSQLSAGIVSEGGSAGPTDVLLDLSAIDTPVQALLLALAADAGAVDARVAVDGSDDLDSWQRIAGAQAVVSLSEGDLRIERLRLELPATAHDYLRLRRTDGREHLPLDSVAAVPAPVQAGLLAAEAESTVLQGVALAADSEAPGEPPPGSFAYASPGPLPVDRIDVRLADRNAIAEVIVQSRPAQDLAWHEQARFTAFNLSDGDASSPPVTLPGIRDRYWRVLTRPAQARAPELELGWTPDRFLMLAQGEPPHALAAGSARIVRNPYPLSVALAQVKAQRGDDWQPPEASLGRGAELAGAAALQPPPRSVPVRQGLLWVVLVLGAAAILWMVLRLLRQPATRD